MVCQGCECLDKEPPLAGDPMARWRGRVVGHRLEQLLAQAEPSQCQEEGGGKIWSFGRWTKGLAKETTDVLVGFVRGIAHGLANFVRGVGVVLQN